MRYGLLTHIDRRGAQWAGPQAWYTRARTAAVPITRFTVTVLSVMTFNPIDNWFEYF